MIGCIVVRATVNITVNEDVPIITYRIHLNCQWECSTCIVELYFLKIFSENLQTLNFLMSSVRG